MAHGEILDGYACIGPRPRHLQSACSEKRKDSHSGCDHSAKDDVSEEQWNKLQDRIDMMDQHIGAGEILSGYNLSKPMSFFASCDKDPAACLLLVRRMCQTKVRARARGIEEWVKLRKDILGTTENAEGVHSLAFSFLKTADCVAAPLHVD